MGACHCVAFLGKAFYSQSSSLQTRVEMGTTKLEKPDRILDWHSLKGKKLIS